MTRLEKLKELEQKLTDAMEEAEAKELAPLAKQYRETIREIEQIEGTKNETDEIFGVLAQRAADGKSEAVRPYKPKAQKNRRG